MMSPRSEWVEIKLGRSHGRRVNQQDQMTQDPAATLQAVYDQVLRSVLRSGKPRPEREVRQLLAAEMRRAFGADFPSDLRADWIRDAEEIAAGRRVVVDSSSDRLGPVRVTPGVHPGPPPGLRNGLTATSDRLLTRSAR